MIMQFTYKIHKQGDDTLLAVADSDLIGKSVSKGEVEIDISEEFYGTETAEEEKIEVGDEDLSAKFYELSKKYRCSVDEIREHYEKNNLMQSLRAETRNEKAVQIIRDSAILK